MDVVYIRLPLFIAETCTVCFLLQSGTTALMFASRFGHREIAELLLEHDPDVNAQDEVRC